MDGTNMVLGTTKKTLKEIEMPQNCGIVALSQLTELKNISAFTLVHAARDNGLNLFVFKVNDLVDLARVQRPAIFHQEGHFVFIKNGEPLPQGKYTGFVLAANVLGRVVGLQEAKFIKGGKNFLTGKNKDGVQEGSGALGSILGVVGGIVGAVVLPGVGGALGLGLSQAAGGAIGGAVGGAVGGELSGNNALISGALGALGGEAIGGGIASASAGGGLAGNAVKNFSQGAFNTISHPIASLGAGGDAIASGIPSASSTLGAFGGGTSASGIGTGTNAANAFNLTNASNAGAMSLAGGGIGTAAGVPISASSNPGSFSLSQFSPNSSFNTSSIPFAAGQGGTSSSSGGIGGTIGNAFTSNPIGTAAGLAGAAGIFGSSQPKPSSVTPGQNYSALNTFLGSTPQGSAANQFGLAASNANTDIVNTSIPDLQKNFTANNQRTLDTINTAYDNQKQSLLHSYAQAGQNLANSSELQNHMTQLEQKRTNDLTLAQQELQDQALGQAIQVKQQALSQGMQSGQFNQTMAMQLASLTGDQQSLQYAIANNDYTSFQQIMGKLLTMGISQSVNVTNNDQQSSMTRTGGL